MLTATIFWIASASANQSALPMLNGFDADRAERILTNNKEDVTAESAKILYQLQRTDDAVLKSLVVANPDKPVVIGDACQIEGVILSIAHTSVPDRLASVLGLQQVDRLTIQTDTRTTLLVITTAISMSADVGDRVTGLGIVLKPDEAVACGTVRWFPAQVRNAGWNLLAEEGVDAGAIAELVNRNRRPLLAEDAEVFYDMLAAAARVGRLPSTPPPAAVDPVSLLRDPDRYIGQWMRIQVESVQITRVAVTEPRRQLQLSADHYFQIDAIGELPTHVVVVIKSDDPEREPVKFENRFPISLVVKELPETFSEALQSRGGTDVIAMEFRRPVIVDGFFFRLWSYDTEYMERSGGGKQFGPLLIGAAMRPVASVGADPLGVRAIGWIAAAAILLGLIGTVLWVAATARGDAKVRADRTSRQSDRLELPDELAD